jgi:hypothetical protein
MYQRNDYKYLFVKLSMRTIRSLRVILLGCVSFVHHTLFASNQIIDSLQKELSSDKSGRLRSAVQSSKKRTEGFFISN